MDMIDDPAQRRKKDVHSTLSTSLGRVLHTQQGVRSMLKSITSRNRNMLSAPGLHTGVTHSDSHMKLWKKYISSDTSSGGGTRAEIRLPHFHFDKPVRHRDVHLQCAVCQASTPSLEADYMYNSTIVKSWMALCPVCSASIETETETEF